MTGEPAAVTITVNGHPIEAPDGTPLGAVLHGISATLRHTPKASAPRGIFCGMGVCFDCLVTIDGRANVRACITPVRAGMRVEST